MASFFLLSVCFVPVYRPAAEKARISLCRLFICSDSLLLAISLGLKMRENSGEGRNSGGGKEFIIGNVRGNDNRRGYCQIFLITNLSFSLEKQSKKEGHSSLAWNEFYKKLAY